MEAYSGGELGEEMLATALACVCPSDVGAWPVDDAFSALDGLRTILVGANMPRISSRLLNRWECSRDLHRVVERALAMSAQSKSLLYERRRTEWSAGAPSGAQAHRVERRRTEWRREYGRLPPKAR